MKLLLSIGLLLASTTLGVAQDKFVNSATATSQETVCCREGQLNNIIKNLTREVPKANAERRSELFRQIKKANRLLTADAPTRVATQRDVLDSVITSYIERQTKRIKTYSYNDAGRLAVMTKSEVSADGVETPVEKYVFYCETPTQEGSDYYYWFEDEWVGVTGSKSDHNANGYQTLYETHEWNSTTKSYCTTFKEVWKYDESGNEILLEEWSDYDMESGEYGTHTTTEHAYSADGQITLYAKYNHVDGQKLLLEKDEIVLDDAGRTISNVYFSGRDEEADTWGSAYKREYNYNANGQIIYHSYYRWDNTTKSFVLQEEDSYDDKGRTTMEFYLSNPGVGYRYTYDYDDDALTCLQTYYETNTDMYPEFGDPSYLLTTYKDSVLGNPLSSVSYDSEHNIDKTRRYVYKAITAEDTTAINKVAADHEMITVLGRKITTEGAESVSVYNLAGQLISTDAVTSVEPGTYIVRVDGKSIKVLVK